MKASTSVLSLFRDITAPTATDVLAARLTDVVVAAFSIFASISAAEVVVTLMPPAEIIVELSMYARVCAGSSSAMLAPNKASTVLNRKFCDLMPIELKASVMPTDTLVPPPSTVVSLSVVALIVEVLEALTVTSPVFVVVTLLSMI